MAEEQFEKRGVPVIDLSRSDDEVAEAIRGACIRHGFFIVRHHDVKKELITQAFAKNIAFFALPLVEKMKISADRNLRGYTAMQGETLDDSAAKGDTKEGLDFGPEVQADGPQSSSGPGSRPRPNQWPSEELVPGYRKAMEAYIQEVSQLGSRLVHLLALALHLPKNYFDQFFHNPMAYLRPLHYSAEKSSEKAGIYGADFGMLTLLKTSEEDGLQIYLDGRWTNVSPPPDGFIINLGDMVERWSNKLFKSTLHRVMGSGRERYSLPFFYSPSSDAKIECLSNCCSPDNPPHFPPTTGGQHVRERYAQTQASYSRPPHGQ